MRCKSSPTVSRMQSTAIPYPVYPQQVPSITTHTCTFENLALTVQEWKPDFTLALKNRHEVTFRHSTGKLYFSSAQNSQFVQVGEELQPIIGNCVASTDINEEPHAAIAAHVTGKDDSARVQLHKVYYERDEELDKVALQSDVIYFQNFSESDTVEKPKCSLVCPSTDPVCDVQFFDSFLSGRSTVDLRYPFVFRSLHQLFYASLLPSSAGADNCRGRDARNMWAIRTKVNLSVPIVASALDPFSATNVTLIDNSGRLILWDFAELGRGDDIDSRVHCRLDTDGVPFLENNRGIPSMTYSGNFPRCVWYTGPRCCSLLRADFRMNCTQNWAFGSRDSIFNLGHLPCGIDAEETITNIHKNVPSRPFEIVVATEKSIIVLDERHSGRLPVAHWYHAMPSRVNGLSAIPLAQDLHGSVIAAASFEHGTIVLCPQSENHSETIVPSKIPVALQHDSTMFRPAKGPCKRELRGCALVTELKLKCSKTAAKKCGFLLACVDSLGNFMLEEFEVVRGMKKSIFSAEEDTFDNSHLPNLPVGLSMHTNIDKSSTKDKSADKTRLLEQTMRSSYPRRFLRSTADRYYYPSRFRQVTVDYNVERAFDEESERFLLDQGPADYLTMVTKLWVSKGEHRRWTQKKTMAEGHKALASDHHKNEMSVEKSGSNDHVMRHELSAELGQEAHLLAETVNASEENFAEKKIDNFFLQGMDHEAVAQVIVNDFYCAVKAKAASALPSKVQCRAQHLKLQAPRRFLTEYALDGPISVGYTGGKWRNHDRMVQRMHKNIARSRGGGSAHPQRYINGDLCREGCTVLTHQENDSIRTQDATKVESKNDWSRILRSVYKQRSASYVKEMKVFDQKMVGKLSTIVPPQPFSDVRVRKRRKEDNTSATDMFAEMFPCDTSADI